MLIRETIKSTTTEISSIFFSHVYIFSPDVSHQQLMICNSFLSLSLYIISIGRTVERLPLITLSAYTHVFYSFYKNLYSIGTMRGSRSTAKLPMEFLVNTCFLLWKSVLSSVLLCRSSRFLQKKSLELFLD